MLRIPGMPLLPGTTFRDLSKTYYPKSQSLMNSHGVSMLNDRRRDVELVDASGGLVDQNCPPAMVPSLYPPNCGTRLPPWVEFDKKVLCFDAYFKETLQEVYHAPYQVRRVKIYYYLEDGTMQIQEPKVENSGIMQGCIVHRQRIPKPPPCEMDFISILDLNVDITIRIFDRFYHIINCDLFTRHFLNRKGIPVPDPVAMPEDPTDAVRKRIVNRISNTPARHNALQQFLQFDRKILRFFGYWDDRSEFGEVRRLEVCYYLADDTIEIRENFSGNSGREGPTLFLRRGRLPREYQCLPKMGEQTPVTLLNVLGTNMSNVRYTVDPLNIGHKEIAYYGVRDLQIGAVVNAYGRAIVLIDCDPYTRDYYKQHYGIENFTPLDMPARANECKPYRLKDRELPPYNGWGSYEDSEGNCKSVEPKQPRIDFKKFIKYDSYVLRFGGKLLSTIRENCERIFVISFFLADDTIQIFEIAERNSGFMGGEFLKRTRLAIPGQDVFTTGRPQYYKPYNFYIGATLSLKDHIFHIVSADEYTLRYMEHHQKEFQHADMKLVMKKLREHLKPVYQDFVKNCSVKNVAIEKDVVYVSNEALKASLIAALGDKISAHEIVTVCRFFAVEQPPPRSCDRETVRAATHLELKRALWNSLDELIEHFHHINPKKIPFLPEVKIRSTLKGCRLPFSAELLDDIMMVLNRNECDEIEVCDLMRFLDMSCGKVPDITPINIAFELCPKIPFLDKGRLVNFSCLLEHLGLDKKEDQHEHDRTGFFHQFDMKLH